MPGLARRVGFCYSLAIAAVSACGSSAAIPSAPSAADPVVDATPRRIVVLGDSLAVSPSRTENFPSHLQRKLDEVAPGWTVKNAAVSGDTTAGGVRRLDEALTSDTRILVLELGANDGLRGLEIAAVERNLAAIIESAQARGIRVLLCGMETPPVRGWNYTLEFHRLFPRLAARYDVPLVPFLLAEVALNPDFNGADGIHPNGAGARLIAETVWPYLLPLIEHESAAGAAVG
jgi:acyl-CoA thioesterase-1